ncbi:MAG: hypothetical protein FVQ83_03125 [Chloroflexi bacterium]|nr:hypothetical protein [Chloroflexota bacterium]
MKRAFIVCGFVVLFGVSLACSLFVTEPTPETSPTPTPEDLEDPKYVEITLVRTVCYGTCPAYTVTVYGDGRVLYFGEMFVEVEGEREYTIPEEDVHLLVELILETDFFSLRDEYTVGATDLPSTTISVTFDERYKSVYVYGGGPDEFHELEQEIDRIARTNELVGSCDFENC